MRVVFFSDGYDARSYVSIFTKIIAVLSVTEKFPIGGFSKGSKLQGLVGMGAHTLGVIPTGLRKIRLKPMTMCKCRIFSQRVRKRSRIQFGCIPLYITTTLFNSVYKVGYNTQQMHLASLHKTKHIPATPASK